MFETGIYSVYRNGRWVYYKSFLAKQAKNGLQGLGPASLGKNGPAYGPEDMGLTVEEAAYVLPPFCIRVHQDGNYPIGKIACGPSLAAVAQKTLQVGGIAALIWDVVTGKRKVKDSK